jgi:hypothetical protein
MPLAPTSWGARTSSELIASIVRGSALYDPAALASVSAASLLAMTALDTTNLRVTFTAPLSGTVFARLRIPQKGSTGNPMTLLGILEGSTVKARAAPMVTTRTGSSTTIYAHEAFFIVTGLTPGQSYTWDAAYGVEVALASTVYGWGGPNNAVASDALGAASFEVWDAPQLLAGTLYDPAVAVLKTMGAALAMTAFDTTNLRLTFTAPATGRVRVQIRCMDSGGTGDFPAYVLGVLDGATVKARIAPVGFATSSGSVATTDHAVRDAQAVIAGLTPGTSYTWDAAYGVERVSTGSNIKYGGPDNTTQDDAYGGLLYAIWEA